ncbi:MAG: PulJ/GspJ family protein, partial [Planctomycetota bacterium]
MFKTSRCPRGFSLAEVIASVTIGAMVLVTMLGIYRQAQTSAAAVERKIEG